MALAKGIVKETFAFPKTLKEVAVITSGFIGAVIGETVMTEKFGKTSDLAKLGGGAAGSIGIGVLVGMFTKSRANGCKAAISGLSYAAFKLFYNRVLAGKTIPLANVIMPALGDFVTVPRQMGDFVTMPRQLGQFAQSPPEGPPFAPASMAGIEDQIDW